jgi:tetratricopeptide (TPR) repeat protein
MHLSRHRSLLLALAFALMATSLALTACGSGDAVEEAADAQRGRELYDAGEFDEAVTLLTDAVEDEPDDVDARKTLALALAAIGDLEGAIAQYEAVVERDSEDHQTLYRLGLLERQAGDSAAASDHLGQAAELHSSDPSYWDEYAKTLVQLGRYQEAAEAWGMVLEIDGITDETRKQMLVNQGEAYVSAKMLDQAETSYERAIEMDPSDQNLAERLAQIRGDAPDG